MVYDLLHIYALERYISEVEFKHQVPLPRNLQGANEVFQIIGNPWRFLLRKYKDHLGKGIYLDVEEVKKVSNELKRSFYKTLTYGNSSKELELYKLDRTRYTLNKILDGRSIIYAKWKEEQIPSCDGKERMVLVLAEVPKEEAEVVFIDHGSKPTRINQLVTINVTVAPMDINANELTYSPRYDGSLYGWLELDFLKAENLIEEDYTFDTKRITRYLKAMA